MRLSAGCELNLKSPKSTPFIAMLRPRSGHAQWVIHQSFEINPFVPGSEYEDAFGNLCQRFVAPADKFSLSTETTVEVAPDIYVDRSAPRADATALPEDSLQYLLPSRYCPSDKMVEQAKEIAGKAGAGYKEVETIVQYIRDNIEYKYGVSDGSTDALGTLSDGAGVCRDFSHIGISMCRALGIPARMVVGYLYELDPMDLHAWFEAYLDDRWYTFDATQKEAKGGRVIIAYGRDAVDVALITELGEFETENMKVWVKKA